MSKMSLMSGKNFKCGLASWAHNDSLSVVMGVSRIYRFETPNRDVAKHGNTVFSFY